ncbi:MAG: hypothetical protein SFY70_13125 [Bacteroidia bacterium]|nr:hypothetical protein [Bacteroidia bacterium]
MPPKVNYHRLLQIGMGLLILIPGIFKVLKPGPFTQYLTESPVQIPGGVALFWPVTVLEIVGSLLLILRPIQRPIIYAGIAFMFMGILGVALLTVAGPEGANLFPDQKEMIQLYLQAHPDKVAADVLPSKLGTIGVLFHLLGMVIFGALAVTEFRRHKGEVA